MIVHKFQRWDFQYSYMSKIKSRTVISIMLNKRAEQWQASLQGVDISAAYLESNSESSATVSVGQSMTEEASRAAKIMPENQPAVSKMMLYLGFCVWFKGQQQPTYAKGIISYRWFLSLVVKK